jgi:hypothetical protein
MSGHGNLDPPSTRAVSAELPRRALSATCTGKKTPGGAGTLVPVKRHRGSRDTHGTHGTRGRAQRHTDHTDEPHCTGKTPVTITGTCSATRDELPVDPYGYKDVGRAPSSHLTLFPNSHLIRRLCGGAENYRNLSDRILTQYRLPPPSVFYRQRAVARVR